MAHTRQSPMVWSLVNSVMAARIFLVNAAAAVSGVAILESGTVVRCLYFELIYVISWLSKKIGKSKIAIQVQSTHDNLIEK